jgi:signal transduction histidine kinase
MRSIKLKLTLAFVLVGLAGAVLVAAFVGRLTRRQFDQFVADNYQAEVLSQAAGYYADNGSWEGFRELLGRRAQTAGLPSGMDSVPFALYDAQGLVVFGDVPDHEPNAAPGGGNAESNAQPVEVDGEIVGYVQFHERPGIGQGGPRRAAGGSPETRFLAGLDRAIRLSAAAAAVLALLLGAALAGTISRPVRELTAATQAVAGGDLGHQVPVRTSDEIGELAKSFNRMSADLAHSNQLRRQMTADIAHDLRTPLSVILGYSEALAEGKLPGTPETFEAMHLQAQHLNRLIDDLRTLSLADAGQLSLHRRPIDPRDLLEHTALACLPAAESRKIALVVEGEDAPPIRVDPDRLLQVLGNLVGNALYHTPDGGRIVLSAARAGEQVLLQIRDSGPGIPDEDLPHIFERFYRGDKARPSSGASGLGLAIARSLVDAHGGQITAENAPDGGALFTIALPLNSALSPP